ncbi:hypothetical protein Taro_007749 [Colocasia esculenta]|uniref:Uncharacterized protein n=1 Tax=Colocasia esculenta TaxID=4460 RepID=A0A843U0I1_COLES|nr:hypothetical protein [Colocasia esculenta]
MEVEKHEEEAQFVVQKEFQDSQLQFMAGPLDHLGVLHLLEELVLEYVWDGVTAWSSDESEDLEDDSPEDSVESGTDISCKGSVDTPPTGVDTMHQTLRQNDEEKCVDTCSSGVDTRSSSQKTCLLVLDSVSTQPEVVSTLVTLPREQILPVWDSVSTHSLDRSTHFGNFFTLSSTWTRGTLGFTWIGLGSCAHTPQGYFWTHWAINTLQLAIQPKRTFSEPSRNPFGGKKCSPPRSCSPGVSSSQFSSVQAREVEFDN